MKLMEFKCDGSDRKDSFFNQNSSFLGSAKTQSLLSQYGNLIQSLFGIPQDLASLFVPPIYPLMPWGPVIDKSPLGLLVSSFWFPMSDAHASSFVHTQNKWIKICGLRLFFVLVIFVFVLMRLRGAAWFSFFFFFFLYILMYFLRYFFLILHT